MKLCALWQLNPSQTFKRMLKMAMAQEYIRDEG
jgi:hypothetical protein